jgi:hypothetical protein
MAADPEPFLRSIAFSVKVGEEKEVDCVLGDTEYVPLVEARGRGCSVHPSDGRLGLSCDAVACVSSGGDAEAEVTFALVVLLCR